MVEFELKKRPTILEFEMTDINVNKSLSDLLNSNTEII